MKKQKGFTLIELLVVIAIIGLLSTIAIVAMGGARAKARDAKRISDIKQMSTLLDIEEAAAPGSFLCGCITADAKATTCTGTSDTAACTILSAGDIGPSFTSLKDPQTSGTTLACTSAAGTAPCDYSISVASGAAGQPKTANYEICFATESASSYGAAGSYKIVNGGTVTGPGAAGCL